MMAVPPSRFVLLTVILLVALFAYTGTAKMLEVKRFELVMAQSPLISKGGAALLAPLVPALEWVVVLLLLFPRSRVVGLWASFLLLGVFTGYIVLMLLFATHLPCSCGGVIGEMSWVQHLLFNLFFWLLSGYSLYLQESAQDFIAINRGSRKPV